MSEVAVLAAAVVGVNGARVTGAVMAILAEAPAGVATLLPKNTVGNRPAPPVGSRVLSLIHI